MRKIDASTIALSGSTALRVWTTGSRFSSWTRAVTPTHPCTQPGITFFGLSSMQIQGQNHLCTKTCAITMIPRAGKTIAGIATEICAWICTYECGQFTTHGSTARHREQNRSRVLFQGRFRIYRCHPPAPAGSAETKGWLDLKRESASVARFSRKKVRPAVFPVCVCEVRTSEDNFAQRCPW